MTLPSFVYRNAKAKAQQKARNKRNIIPAVADANVVRRSHAREASTTPRHTDAVTSSSSEGTQKDASNEEGTEGDADPLVEGIDFAYI